MWTHFTHNYTTNRLVDAQALVLPDPRAFTLAGHSFHYRQRPFPAELAISVYICDPGTRPERRSQHPLEAFRHISMAAMQLVFCGYRIDDVLLFSKV